MNNLNVSKCMRDEKLMYIIIGFILGVIGCILIERIVRTLLILMVIQFQELIYFLQHHQIM